MYFEQIRETVSFISARTNGPVSLGIVLGSGLGPMADMVEEAQVIPYAGIPHFPQSTVEGHAGKLILGRLRGKNVIMMSGRFHYYEGYNMEEVTFPIRVMQLLGIHTLFLSNAAGGMNAQFQVGDIMMIRDHINLFPEQPLRGPNDPRLGIRFPDMSEPYSLELIARAQQIAGQRGMPLQEGIYAGLQGPSFETRAEYRWLHTIGADAVGMSTVPEVIVARHGGIQVVAASIISNMGIRSEQNTVTHDEVLMAAHKAAGNLALLFADLIATLP